MIGRKYKKFKLLGLLSFSIVSGGALLSLPLIDTACSKKTPPASSIVEIGDEINEEKAEPYLVPIGEETTETTVYTNANNSVTFQHRLLDLKSFYESETANPEHQSLFTITSNINFGFLISPDMVDIHINAINDAMITCTSTTLAAAGIVIGRVSTDDADAVPYQESDWEFNGDLTIDNNVSFNISSQDSNAYGVYFFPPNSNYLTPPETNSEIYLNGTFLISSAYAKSYGIWYGSPTRQGSNLKTYGTFIMQAYGECCGVYITGYAYGQSGRTDSFGTFVIKGCWFVRSINDKSEGVYFTVMDSSVSVNFSGIFNVFGKEDSSCYVGDTNNRTPYGDRHEDLESNSTFFVTSFDGFANFLDCANILGNEKFGDFGGIWVQNDNGTKYCRVLKYLAASSGGSNMNNVSFDMENLYVLKNNGETQNDFSASSFNQSGGMPGTAGWRAKFPILTDKMQCVSNKNDWWTNGVQHQVPAAVPTTYQSYDTPDDYRTWTTKEDLPNPTIITIPTLENAPQWKIGYYDCDGNSGDTKQHMKSALQDYSSIETCPTLAKGWILSALQLM